MKRIDLAGQKFGRLVVIGYSHTKKGFAYSKARCDCGNEVVVCNSRLKNGYTQSCGCWRRFLGAHRSKCRIKDLTDKKFGKLTARWLAGRTRKKTYWLCSCDCGGLRLATQGNLMSGQTKSCGCQKGNYSHGKTGTPEYKLWKQAHKRAKEKDLPFDLELNDIVIPEICPLLGIPLYPGKGRLFHDNSPSIDRIIPSLGYVKGNTQVISFRANRIKTNATLEEIKMLVENWEKQNCDCSV